jgi:hypothetical protein
MVVVAAAAVAAMEDVLHQGPWADMIRVECAGEQQHSQAVGLTWLPACANAVISQGDKASRHNDTEQLVLEHAV